MMSTTPLLAMDDEEPSQSSLGVKQNFIQTLPNELMLQIFSYLNQRDVPSATRTCCLWATYMNDAQLWKGYATRAFGIIREEVEHYKPVIQELSVFSFIPLGTLNEEEYSFAKSVSYDGSVVVGWTQNNTMEGNTVHFNTKAFRWTQETGMKFLGDLNGGKNSKANAVSGNGSVVVGWANDGAETYKTRAFRWTRDAGMKSLGTLNDGTFGIPYAVSGNGLVVVGKATDGPELDNESTAFQWTSETGMEPFLGGVESYAVAVSDDGLVIAGNEGEEGEGAAFRWTKENGMIFLKDLLITNGASLPDWERIEVGGMTPNGVVYVGSGVLWPKDEMERQIPHAWRAVVPRRDLF